MKKLFEEFLSEIQTDMVSICMENVDGRAENVYIYTSYENRTVVSVYFYKINGKYVRRHELNLAISADETQYDVSTDRQGDVLSILNKDIIQLITLCDEFGMPMPTEMKLYYRVIENKLKTEFSYDNKYSDDPTFSTSAHDIAEKWFKEIQTGVF